MFTQTIFQKCKRGGGGGEHVHLSFIYRFNYETVEKKDRGTKLMLPGSSERSFKRTPVTRKKGIVLLAVQDTFKELKYLMQKKSLRSRRLKAKHCLLKPGIQ